MVCEQGLARVGVDDVVDPGQFATPGVVERDDRVQRRAEPARPDVDGQNLAGLGGEPEVVVVAVALGAAIDGYRHSDPVGLGRRVVGLALADLGVLAHGERQAVTVRRPDGDNRAAVGSRRHLERGRREVDTVQLDLRRSAALASHGEDIRQVGHHADGEPVEERVAAPEEDIPDFEQVVAVLRGLEDEHGVRAERRVVDPGDLVAAGVVKRQAPVEPAGHRVGDVGQQGPALERADERLTGLHLDAEEVAVGLGELSVDEHGQGIELLGLRRLGIRLDLVHLGERSDHEAVAVRHAAERGDADIALAGFRVGGDRDRDLDRIGLAGQNHLRGHAGTAHAHGAGPLEVRAGDDGLRRLASLPARRKHATDQRLGRLRERPRRAHGQQQEKDGREPLPSRSVAAMPVRTHQTVPPAFQGLAVWCL